MVTVIGPSTACAVVASDGATGWVIAVVGRPGGEVLAKAARFHPEAEVLIQSGARAHFERLAGTPARRAVLHTLPEGLRPTPGLETILLLSHNAAALSGLPAPLRAELRAAIERVPVAAALIGKDHVSFCYAGAVTDTLWDVSIDTLPTHRRRGGATSAFAAMALHMGHAGCRPV